MNILCLQLLQYEDSLLLMLYMLFVILAECCLGFGWMKTKHLKTVPFLKLIWAISRTKKVFFNCI